jgi:hypothetical protein
MTDENRKGPAGLAGLRKHGLGLPNRYVIYGVEGIGKTTLGSLFPAPVFLQSKGETGLDTLLTSGQLKEVPHFPEAEMWSDALDNVDLLRTEPHDLKTLVVDTANGLESLCCAKVTKESFGGDSGPDGFLAYGKGPKVAGDTWTELLNRLDRLRVERQMTIILLAHSRVTGFRNPIGPDYDRFSPAMFGETWNITHRWADLVLFLNYEVFVEGGGEKKKGKATGKDRIMYTARDAAYDAKNRHGLMPEIPLGSTVDSMWQAFTEALKNGRKVVRNGN